MKTTLTMSWFSGNRTNGDHLFEQLVSSSFVISIFLVSINQTHYNYYVKYFELGGSYKKVGFFINL